MVEKNKGNTPVFLSLRGNGSRGSLYELKNFRVKVTRDLINKIVEIFGKESIRLNC